MWRSLKVDNLLGAGVGGGMETMKKMSGAGLGLGGQHAANKGESQSAAMGCVLKPEVLQLVLAEALSQNVFSSMSVSSLIFFPSPLPYPSPSSPALSLCVLTPKSSPTSTGS